MGARKSIEEMRRAGMNDISIGWVIVDIREAALFEEKIRFERLMAENPRKAGLNGFEVAEQINAKKPNSEL